MAEYTTAWPGRLVEQGFVVYAQDLRGYGRWQEKSYKVLCGDERIADPNFRDQSIMWQPSPPCAPMMAARWPK